MMPEEIEKELKECDDRIYLIKHSLATTEQRIQYLQDRIEKLRSGEWDANTLLKDVIPVRGKLHIDIIKSPPKAPKDAGPPAETSAKMVTIQLYHKLLEKVKAPCFNMEDYQSVHVIKRALVPEFKKYVNSCPLCHYYLNTKPGGCKRCPLGSCSNTAGTHWERMVKAHNCTNVFGFIAAITALIRTVEDSK